MAFFDHHFYLQTYMSGKYQSDPFEHYLLNVRKNKVNPSRKFSETDYLNRYSDVAAAVDAGSFICGFHHFVVFGFKEGRLPLGEVDRGVKEGAAAANDLWCSSEDHLDDIAKQATEDDPLTIVLTYEERHENETLAVDKHGSAINNGSHCSSTITFQLNLIKQSGLFDEQWYKEKYSDVASMDMDALEHFFGFGYREGRRPNPYFDPVWYLSQNPDVAGAGIHPLTHYISAGDAEGRRPILYFDPSWYRLTFGSGDPIQLTLAHYLAHRLSASVSPNQYFDATYYCDTYPDIRAAKVDPFEHYLNQGFREGRDPSDKFKTSYYISKYLNGRADKNPLVHYLEHGLAAGFVPYQSPDDGSIPSEVQRFVKPGPWFEEFSPLRAVHRPDVKLIAYYLPQFHPFPENDGWWGRGFTEWTNTARGLPRYVGHYQPRIPRDLGFYSLDHENVLRRQVALARDAGVYGFCFYFYWFNRKRLMEKPVDRFLDDCSIDFPFCLMWANENWTRRWDGAASEVLIAQGYAPEDDAALVADFARHMRDPRYVRIGGRALLMIYRPGKIPDATTAIARWREEFRRSHGEDPIILMAQGFDDNDPRPYGLDGAVEFPPHKLVSGLPRINHSLQLLDHNFSANVHDYDEVMAKSLGEAAPPFPLIKTAVPSWDNDARRQGQGLVLHGSTPAKYEAWLRHLIAYARKNKVFGESFVCVNAWNEWAEGTYLEPDLHFGAAYLNASSRALCTSDAGERRRMLLVGHDAFPGGAQLLLLNFGRLFAKRFGVTTSFVLRDDGALLEQYREVGRVDVVKSLSDLAAFADARRAEGFTRAIVNTTAASDAVPGLSAAGIETILLVHELPRIMKEKYLVERARAASSLVQAIVFPAKFVAEQFQAAVEPVEQAEIVIRPQGLYRPFEIANGLRERTRASLGLGPDDVLFINLGYADLRKGFDLFLQMWRLAQATRPGVHFAWIGNIDPTLESWLGNEFAFARASGTFHHRPFTPEVDAFYAAADALVLTSREDPFPSVVLEAISAGKPVVVFEGSGGIPEIVSPGIGRVVPYGDAPAMLSAALDCIVSSGSDDDRAARRRLIEERFDFADYGWFLLQKLGLVGPRVSVIVPNYNYARYLRERLGSIFAQTAPSYEVIVLDDASTDTSLAELDVLRRECGREFRLLANETNSGSVFRQWRRGLAEAAGDLVWIAEADDACNLTFLDRLLAAFEDERVVFAFADSASMDSDGEPLGESYKDYYATVAPGVLGRDAVFEGREFLATHISVKNLILNVSAVVWRKAALEQAMQRCEADLASLKMAGDWRIYAEACLLPDARIAYVSAPLNRHRRHATSVTHALNAEKHLAEVAYLHRIIGDRLGLADAGRRAQAAYREELWAQFGLVT